ncbi:type VI secretion system protein TssA [Pseudomonas cannabina]|uniref:ImpA n=3 Tax=Pseudomonas syringae group TaxID=136849 RepID=I0BW23_PSECA|nr:MULTISPECIES: type VI secretion system protein TssA [Pseudomonas syringae group]AFH66621.1 ImpA [Pseudomonas cannabina]KPB71100.1 ImpA [Pseudomonas syringae pv. maculicola]KPW20204.1 ImpA [Pseudomonas cannabina pv. alisalensis]MBM0142466.1 type VI secretion system protein TssA [Pseudomonas cannabina pv. alisalensis]QHE97044.1 type VI secretion system protein TssA [Pseudomonas syringae pv. maculicola str. ES4326]
MTYKDKLSIRYLDIARRSVADQDYAGQDVRFSTIYESLEQELGITQSTLGHLNVDWPKIREGSESILVSQSKDLRVASWLAWALYECESFAGLVAGLRLIHHLCERHWQVLHPRKLRTRSAAIAWLVLRLEKVLAEDVSIANQLTVFQQLAKYLDQLDEILGGHLGDDAPLLLPLRRRLARMIERALHAEKEPVTVVEQVKKVAAQLFSSSPSVENEKDAQRASNSLYETARDLCKWWLKQKTTDPRAFRLARAIAWLAIDSTPECNAQKITQLRGLPVEKPRHYQERFEQGFYADLIVDVEASLMSAPFWFDGQRLIWGCLKALDATAALHEVEAHLASLLKRIPEVTELRFHDGTPFADTETLAWIDAHIMPPVVSVQHRCETDGISGLPEWEAVYEELVSGLQAGGFKPAVQILNQHLHIAKGGRERFFWRLCLARLCHQAKEYTLAKIQLEFLDGQLQSSSLHEWEPAVFLDVSRLLYDCYERLPQSDKSISRKEELYQRLCHYDIERLIA